jgi:hypothetical protein
MFSVVNCEKLIFVPFPGVIADFEEAQQQQLAKGNGNNNGNPHQWQEQFAQWNLNN